MGKTTYLLLAFAMSILLINCSPETKKPSILTKNMEKQNSSQANKLTDSLQMISDIEKEHLKNDPDAWLTEIVDSTLEITSQQKLDSLLFPKLLSYKEENKEITFDLSDKWVLTSSSTISVKGCYALAGKRTYYVVKEKKYFLTGQDIYEVFNLNEEKKPLNYIPSNIGRIDQWTAILTDKDTLLIQHLHSYPDGSQTCFYHEKIYRFIKYTL